MKASSSYLRLCFYCVFAFAPLLFCGFAFGATVYVDDSNSTGIEDGSASNPFSTIQEGIDGASEGDTVVVADGTYRGEGNKNLDFKGKTISVSSEKGPEACIIDCQGDGRGFFFHRGEGQESVVFGFTITNGQQSNGGGGIYCDSVSPSISNCVLSNNTAGSGGGGIYCYCSAPTITNCTFVENTANPRGGAFHADCSSSIITNCIFTGNTASSEGGAFYFSCSAPAITNCTITNNTSSSEDGGAGIYSKCSSPTITNCILWGNIQQGQGQGNGIHQSDEICACGGRAPTVTYSIVQGGYPGEGNIDADPLFVNAAGGDYYLKAEPPDTISPCIDAGDNAGVPPDVIVDIADKSRFYGSSCAPDSGKGTPPIVDIGAYEFQFLDEDDDGMEDCWEIQHFGNLDRDGSGDYDSDGLTDLWEFENGMNPEVDDGFQDADEDGFCNLREYLGGTDPKDSEDTPEPSTIYVDDDATEPEDGSAAHPFNTIQEGIDCAGTFADTEGTDVVQVLNGTYTGGGNKNLDFEGKAITVRSENGPEACIIDCEGDGGGFCFRSGEGEDSVVSGLTIRNGALDSGGGIHCTNNSSPTLDDCKISGNLAAHEGGGVYCYQSSPVMTNCTISGNSSNGDYGGGLYCSSSSLTLTNCTISGNSVNCYGGGLFSRYSSPRVTNCTITSNSAGLGGGGIYCKDSDLQISNTIFEGNTKHAIFEGNIHSDPSVVYCLFYNNPDGDYYDESTTSHTGANDINLNVDEADNNVGGNPLFVRNPSPGDDGQWGTSDDDYGDVRLQNGSSALDRGTSAGAPETDFEGDERPGTDELFDIGVDEAPFDYEPTDDTQAPVSRVEGAASMVTTPVLDVPWVASDAESGVQYVKLYYRKDGGLWTQYGGSFTSSPISFDSFSTGDGFYEFCTVATDNAGNSEAVPSTPSGETVVVTNFSGSRLYVDKDATGSRTGTDWTNGCHELGLALILAETFAVGEVWVADGIYEESITLVSGVLLYGGFAGAEALLSERDVAHNATIIDVSTADGGGPANHGVVMESVTDVILDGFTVTGGNGQSPDNRGGGIYCNNADTSNTIANCTIRGNSADYGGGVDCYMSSSPTITDCTITGNTASIRGGGICCRDESSPTITNCTVSDNTTHEKGGAGILCYHSSPIITNCTISDNTAALYDGGGIYCLMSSSPTITNCMITGNTAALRYGGGICCRNDSTESSPIITNCTISDNMAGSSGGGIGGYSSSPTITNCILWENTPDEIAGITPTVTYSDIQGGYEGEGNIDDNPLLVGEGDYHLVEGSPCIDAGASEQVPDIDIDGDSRPQGSGYDIGADEYLCDNDNDGVPDQKEQGPEGTDLGYDGNDDGTPDCEQNNVVSCHTFDQQHYVTLACADTATFRDAGAVENPSPGDAPSEIEFPYGFFTFTIKDVNPGEAITVNLYLPTDPETYYKYGPTPEDPADHWYEFLYDGKTGAEITGNVVTLHFVDGERGDADLDDANGTIVDPGGPGVVTSGDGDSRHSDGGGGDGGGGCFIGTLADTFRL